MEKDNTKYDTHKSHGGYYPLFICNQRSCKFCDKRFLCDLYEEKNVTETEQKYIDKYVNLCDSYQNY